MQLEINITITRPGGDMECGVTGTVNGGYGRVDEVIIDGATCRCHGQPLTLSDDDQRQIENALVCAAIDAGEDARERALERSYREPWE